MNAPLDWSTLANGATPPLNIAAFPGWGMPVLKALVHSAKCGLAREALGHLTPEDVDRGIAAAETIIEAQEKGAILLESRDLGKAFGLDLFERTASQIAEELSADRTETDEPALAMNVPAMLRRFHEAALSITTLHAHVPGDPSEVAFAHWCAARAALGGEIVQLVGGMLADAAVTLNRTKELDEWCDGLADVVMAKVFPNWTDEPKSEAWVQERLGRYEEVRLALLKHHGWDAANG